MVGDLLVSAVCFLRGFAVLAAPLVQRIAIFLLSEKALCPGLLEQVEEQYSVPW
jgi:hypothetical protein